MDAELETETRHRLVLSGTRAEFEALKDMMQNAMVVPEGAMEAHVRSKIFHAIRDGVK